MNPFDVMVKQLAAAAKVVRRKRAGRPAVLPLATRKRIHQALQENRFQGNRRKIAAQFGVERHHVDNIAARGEP